MTADPTHRQTPRTPAWIRALDDEPFTVVGAPTVRQTGVVVGDVVPVTSVTALTPATPAPRPDPYVTAIECRHLIVDHTYQRDLDQRRVTKMVAEFDLTLLGVIEVSDRGNGTYAVLEGQHRMAAVQAAKGPAHHLVCQVHRGLTLADEARVFYEIDRRRKTLNGWDRWKARRGAGDPKVHEIETILTTFRLRVEMSDVDGAVRSTAALEKVMTLGGRPLLTSTLSVLIAAYRLKQDAYDGHIIQGVADVMRYYRPDDELTIDRLVTALQTIAPRQLKSRAAALRDGFAGTMPRLIGSVIITAYNQQPGRNLQPFLDRIKPHTNDHNRSRAEHTTQVRVWAAEQGITVPQNSGVPKEVHAAYDQAHPAVT